jgi:hypothetical protein
MGKGKKPMKNMKKNPKTPRRQPMKGKAPVAQKGAKKARKGFFKNSVKSVS